MAPRGKRPTRDEPQEPDDPIPRARRSPPATPAPLPPDRELQQQERARQVDDSRKKTEAIGDQLWSMHQIVAGMPRDQMSDDLYRLDEQIVRYLDKHGPEAPPDPSKVNAPAAAELDKGT
jgi:hypothetical protein